MHACDSYRHQARRGIPAVALWTWGNHLAEPMCQNCLDDAFDYADEDVISEPERVEWFDGTRVLVAA